MRGRQSSGSKAHPLVVVTHNLRYILIVLASVSSLPLLALLNSISTYVFVYLSLCLLR